MHTGIRILINQSLLEVKDSFLTWLIERKKTSAKSSAGMHISSQFPRDSISR